MKIEVWSDVVCPWCYIGKRRLERAIAAFEGDVDVHWRSFELDPGAPQAVSTPLDQAIARKYRMPLDAAQAMMNRVTSLAVAEGLDLRFDLAQTGNTFDAHRLIHLAASHDLAPVAKERLLRAYFVEGRAISEADVLIELGAEIGLDADEVATMLASDAYADDVRADEAAAKAIGAHGVPFFLIDGKYGVSGAQEVGTFLKVFEQVRSLDRAGSTSPAESCDDGSCSN